MDGCGSALSPQAPPAHPLGRGSQGLHICLVPGAYSPPAPASPLASLRAARRRRPGSPELLRCKRRPAPAPGTPLPPPPPPPQQAGPDPGPGVGAAAVARRNERERNRVKLVNLGFQALRQHVPNGVASKKMSKVETLRSAVEYIRALQQLLAQQDGFLGAGPPQPPGPGAQCRGGGDPCPCAASYASASSSLDSSSPHREGSSVPGSPHSPSSSDESGYEGTLSPEERELLELSSWLGVC